MEKEILDFLKAMQTDMNSIKSDIGSIKSDIGSLKSDVSSLKSDVSSLKNDVSLIKNEIESMKATQNEHTSILKALEHRTMTISAEQENLKHQVVEISGDIKNIRKDLNNVELITASNWTDIARLKAVK